jgi:DNA-binding response OmpR family regulator
VEDHGPLLELIETVLSDAGYNVITAASGDEALRLAGESPVDLLLTDIGIPGIRGDALVQRFQAQSRNSGVVIMSGSDRDTLQDVGARFLQKPFTSKSLLAIVLETLNERLR